MGYAELVRRHFICGSYRRVQGRLDPTGGISKVHEDIIIRLRLYGLVRVYNFIGRPEVQVSIWRGYNGWDEKVIFIVGSSF